MQDMLVDVELASSLHRDLALQSQVAKLEKQSLQHESALSEERAMKSQRRQQQVSLADTLVQELWTLSQELGELRRWKETHETTVMDHDETVAKLLQAEELIRVLESRPAASFGGEGETTDANERPPPSEPQSTVIIVPKTNTADDTAPQSPAVISEPDSFEDAAPQETEGIKKQVDKVPAGDAGESSAAQDEVVLEEEAEPDDEAVVALLQEEDGDIPNLDTLDMTVLTEIFEFLDALEILNTAQVNITMYSRVDALFGFGAGAAAVEETVPPVAPQAASIPPPAPSSVSSVASNAASSSNASRTHVDAAPTKMPAQPLSNPSPPTNAPRRGGIFSLLQSRGVPIGRQTAITDQPLSAAMTDSMVSKLTDKELSAIFSLTEKLHQREKAVAAITAEKEELAGKLQGTEALKGFLINKVRDVEQSLKKSQEDEIKVTQQISSDQEVIAFLDGRVQELERNTAALTEEKKTIVENMTRLHSQNEKKIEVLSDMLQFERERVSTNEREWKSTKKLLVKEIKSCRAQLMALQAERDGFREQNERLKKAVLAMNPSFVNGGI
jgi:DNA repair exonuclease SbcCD ATPase subunit